MTDPIKILIADDKQDICESLKLNLLIEIQKFNLSEDSIDVKMVFTDHAYDHGCKLLTEKGFHPDICIFDLVFNGYTGVDLYKYILHEFPNKKIDLCIYTGVEKTYEKRKEADILASQTQGLITIITKPNINDVLHWFNDILIKKYRFKTIVEDGGDPFDLL